MNIPKLRFKEFNDEWIKIDLSTCFEYFSTNSLSREQLSDHGIIKNIHYGDIHKKYGNVVDVENDVATYIKDTDQINKYEFCCENDIIFADASEDYDGIGKAIELINVNEKLVSGLHTIHARDKKQFFSPLFKGYYFNTPIIHNQIRILANGFKVFGISKDNINNLKVMLPSKQEQDKIAKLLSLLDKKIELQTKKIEALKLFKLCILKHIFSSATVKIKLKDVSNIVKGKQINSEELSKSGSYYMLNGGTEPSGYLEKYNTLENTITISEGGNSCGYVKYNKYKFWCGGHCYSIKNKLIDKHYLYQLLKFNEKKIMRLRIGSGLPNIQKKDLENFELFIHEKNNQYKIANLLMKYDTKIELEKNKLDKLTSLKTGLLQNMFI